MTAAAPSLFAIDDALPSGGTTLIQASAGTGKTYALAALTVRYVAERDVPISKILLVTFTRAATAELRDRIRKRLVEAADHIAGLIAGAESGSVDDPLLEVISRGTPAELGERHGRLRRAVRDFDTATISTIHGFCSQVRSSMGVLSPDNIDAVPADSEGELISQVCADLLFRQLDEATADPLGGRGLSGFVKLVRKARTLSDSRIQAESGKDEDRSVVDLVAAAIAEIDDRLARTGGLSYDSLLSSVRKALLAEPDLAGQLRSLYDVALIDEFQDTDSVQWDIFRTVFGDENHRSTLILVGDPKQAIYSFRGGDVYTYLEAKKQATVVALGTNQRSDEAAVAAMNALGEGHVFGEPEIDYQVVEPAERHRGRRLLEAGGAPAPGLVVRCLVDPAAAGVDKLASGPARRRIAIDLADVAADLIADGVVETPGKDPVPVTAGMIAVLVGATGEAAPIADALRRRGIPAVLRLKDNVADSEAHSQWRTLLWALERPANSQRATAAALTWFFGWPPEQVAAAIEALSADRVPAADVAEDPIAHELVALQLQLVEWSDLLATKGMAALLGEARRSNGLDQRLLGVAQGERNLTDLEHLAELVHAEIKTRGGGVSASTALTILDGLSSAPTDEVAADSAQRRIESDADAVQIMTIHGAKGLEFPIVLLPSLWAGGKRVQAEAPYSFYDDGQRHRVLDVSTGHPKDENRPKRTPAQMAPVAAAEAKRQACGDQHRMTYVALTRAVHQSVVWWSPVSSVGGELSGLARLLFGASGDGAADGKVAVPPPDETIQHLQDRFVDRGAGTAIRVTEISSPTGSSGVLPQPTTTDADAALAVATLGRDLPRDARFWSFSSLSKFIRSDQTPTGLADPTDEYGDDRGAGDEDGARLPSETVAGEAHEPCVMNGADRPSPFDGLGAGKDFGNLVHDLFEHLDFRTDDLDTAVAGLLVSRGGSVVTEEQHARLPKVLADVVRTPLGEAFGNLRLADLEATDHLDEMNFYLPVAPDRPVSASSIGTVIRSHLDDDDLLAPWAERLATGLANLDLQGYLNGSIDLTLRYRVDGGYRYSVVDYKTNNLAPQGTTGLLSHYGPEQMAKTMAHSHYALQAIIYSVALHRYLRWRLPDYEPAVHLGPVGYLFVRAMVGAETPVVTSGAHAGTPAGVFTWQLPPTLVEAVSSLFAGDEGGERR